MEKTLVQKFHIHPISAHFPSAFFPFSTLFLILFIIKNDNAFEVGVKFTQWAAVVTNPFAIISGLLDWKVKYKAAMVPIFKKKITYSIAAETVGIICVVWHSLIPGVFTDSFFVYIYLVLTVTSTVFTFFVGRWGARLVYL